MYGLREDGTSGRFVGLSKRWRGSLGVHTVPAHVDSWGVDEILQSSETKEKKSKINSPNVLEELNG